MPRALALCVAAILLGTAARADERQLAATLHFAVGQAELNAEHRVLLDDVLRRHPPAGFVYSFEGDHDDTRFRGLSAAASERLSERLAETRWQGVAAYLGVEPLGLVRRTGSTEVRVYVESRPAAGGVPETGALADSVSRLRSELEAVRREVAARPPLPAAAVPAAALQQHEPGLAVARIEAMYTRTDKWLDRRWSESGLGLEVGLLRDERETGAPRSGATLAVSDGTFAYKPLDISLRLDVLRLGWSCLGVTPALRWIDWTLRLHYGDDAAAGTSFFSDSDPIYTAGLDLDAAPWQGGSVRLAWIGAGARVHADHRGFVGYDHYDLRLAQELRRRWRVEAQAVYDERFEKSLPYAGGWLAYAWPLRVGEFSVRVGFVEQLDALAATTGRHREDPVSTLSVGVAWERRSPVER